MGSLVFCYNVTTDVNGKMNSEICRTMFCSHGAKYYKADKKMVPLSSVTKLQKQLQIKCHQWPDVDPIEHVFQLLKTKLKMAVRCLKGL